MASVSPATVSRSLRGQSKVAARTRQRVAADWTAMPGLERMLPFLETKTVWHPKGV